jgi:hypothetical protein
MKFFATLAVLGAGGFAVYWFAIRGKSGEDAIAATGVHTN